MVWTIRIRSTRTFTIGTYSHDAAVKRPDAEHFSIETVEKSPTDDEVSTGNGRIKAGVAANESRAIWDPVGVLSFKASRLGSDVILVKLLNSVLSSASLPSV